MKEIITNHPARCQVALEALRQVTDPEIGLNIVDLGLVFQVDFDEERQKIFLSMTLTTPFCPMGGHIRGSAEKALQDAFPEYGVYLSLIFDPPWSTDNLSEAGKNFLKQ